MNFKNILVTHLLNLIIALISIQPGSAQNIYKTISAEKCDSLVQANEFNPDFVILDVRTHGEWAPDHLEGSINRSTRDADFQQQLEALPKHKIFLLHCQSGGRSAGAFAKMKTLQFAEVYEMQNGINGWKANTLPTTSKLAPKLMLVSHTDSLPNSVGIDTINITITNRANDILKFSSAMITDFHAITHNFDLQKTLTGAEDYTFSVIHDPGYSEDDSTKVLLKSNGGDLEINIVFKNGLIQSIESDFEENDLVIYPNPAKNKFFIKNNSLLKIEELSLINLSGQAVFYDINYTNNGIDISYLKNGIYFARIKTDKEIFSRKVIIKH